MTPKRPATYADLEALPDNVVGEIIDDELFVSPRPRPRHGLAAGEIGAALSGPFRHGEGGPGGWWILPEPELHLGRLVLVPDLAGWRRERMPVFPEAVGIELAPDWVCEVARHAISYAWLVDPVLRTLEVLRREGTRWLILDVFEGDDRVRAEPFDAIELALARWWLPAVEPSRVSEPAATYQVLPRG